jgi:hypothetical protein
MPKKRAQKTHLSWVLEETFHAEDQFALSGR